MKKVFWKAVEWFVLGFCILIAITLYVSFFQLMGMLVP